MESHNLDHLFGYEFHDRYVAFIRESQLGASIEWTQRLSCMMCGALVSFPITHKNWHKRNKDL